MLLRDRRDRRRRDLHDRMKPYSRPVTGLPSPFHLPRGKGIFVRALSHAGTPEQMVQRCQWANLRWVSIQILWQHPDHDKPTNLDTLGAYADALRAAGIDVWVWGFPERASPRQLTFTQTLAHAAVTAHAAGIILDAEGPWVGASDAEASGFVKRMRSAAPGREIGLTSYGNVLGFPEFPWEGFSSCDLGIPQVYHGHEQFGPGYQAAGVAAYQALGFAAVIPALAAYKVTVPEMLEIYARTPKPQDAVIWWDWYNASVDGTWAGIRNAGVLEAAVAAR